MERRAKRGREAADDGPRRCCRGVRPSRASPPRRRARRGRSSTRARRPRGRPEPRPQHPGLKPEARPEFAPRPSRRAARAGASRRPAGESPPADRPPRPQQARAMSGPMHQTLRVTGTRPPGTRHLPHPPARPGAGRRHPARPVRDAPPAAHDRPAPGPAVRPLRHRPRRDGRPVAVDVVYLVVGKMTGRLVEVQPGESLEVWGPLGNGFPDLGPASATSPWSPAASARRRSWPTRATARHARLRRAAPAPDGRPGLVLLRRPHRGPRGGRRGLPRRRGRGPPRQRRRHASASAATSRRLLAKHEPPGPARRLRPGADAPRPEPAGRRHGACRATSRWRRRWPAASASASVAS